MLWQPVIGALNFRLTIPETPRYTMNITMDMEKVKAESDAYLSGKRADNAKVTDKALAKARPIAAGPKATWTEFWQYYR